MNDTELLQRFARERDETAFTEFVRRHAGLVHATALRASQGDTHMAHDVTQRVFIALARKAGRLAHHPALLGWLHRAAWLDTLATRRAEARRRNRETDAVAQSALSTAGPEADWRQVAPLLDDALDRLSEKDREAVLARYVADLPFAAVGERLGLGENAARMRTERALKKLKNNLSARGVTSTVALLGSALSAHAAAGPVTPAVVTEFARNAIAASPLARAGEGTGFTLLHRYLTRTVGLAVTGAVLLSVGWWGINSLSSTGYLKERSETSPVLASADSAQVDVKPTDQPSISQPLWGAYPNFEAWARALLNAPTPDSAYALLREAGVTLSRQSFNAAYAESLDSWATNNNGDPISMCMGICLWPVINAWITEDLDAAGRWILSGTIPQGHIGLWLNHWLSLGRATPDTLAA